MSHGYSSAMMIATEELTRIVAEQRDALHYAPKVPYGGTDAPIVADLLINRASIAFESLKTQWTATLGLGTHERMAISQLWIYGPMQMSELASRISLSRAAVTTLIDRLESDGWLRRSNDPADRRRTILHLEPYAIKRRREVSTDFEKELCKWADDIDPEEWRTIVRFLDMLWEVSTRHADIARHNVPPR